MSIDMEWLERHIVLRELTADERTALECLKEKTFGAHDTIIAQGQQGGMLYILRSGAASVEDINESDRVRIADVTEGALLGEMSFLSGKQTTAEVIASEDCVVYTLSRDDFSNIMRDQQNAAYAILARMLASQANIIQKMNAELLPLWRNLKKKAAKLPLIIKLLPIIFTLVYASALAYVSLRDHSS
jgi:CRP-like cAMP-binding protein